MIPLGAVTSVTRLIASTLFRAFAASISFCTPLAAVCGKPYLIIRVCTERIATAPFFVLDAATIYILSSIESIQWRATPNT